jgi:hypothetical protein
VTIDLKSLHVKNDLNDKIWTPEKKLDPEIRARLIEIALDFYHDLEVPWAQLEDILFTGSLANYNWSKYSDVDIHLLIDYSLVDEKEDLVENYFKARKNLWNNQHDIKIHDYDVELYVQDADEQHVASGLYSVKNDVWITEPKVQKPTIEEKSIRKKAQVIMRLIDDVHKLYKSDKYETAISEAERLSEKIKKFRTCGLERGGEYSVENLTFKVLRRNGYLEKLWDVKVNAYDKMMTME